MVPLLALGFVAGEFAWMRARGAEVIANAVRVVEDKGSGTRVFTAVGYFAPERGALTADLPAAALPLRVEAPTALPPGGTPTGSTGAPSPFAAVPYTVLQAGSGLEAMFRPDTRWGLRSVAYEQVPAGAAARSGAGGLSADLTLVGNTLVGEVHNGTRLPLAHVSLLDGTAYVTLPVVAPGASSPLRLQVPAAPPVVVSGAFGAGTATGPLGWLLFLRPHLAGAATAGSGHGGARPRPTRPPRTGAALPFTCCAAVLNPALMSVAQRREADLLDGLLGQFSPGASGPWQFGPPLLRVAWTEGRGQPAHWPGLPAPPYLLTMYLLTPVLRLPPGPFTLGPGLVAPMSLHTSGGTGFSGAPPAMALQSGATATFQFHAPMPPGADVRSVGLTVALHPSPAANGQAAIVGPPGATAIPAPRGALAVYDYATGAWQPLAGAERFRLGPGVVGPGGAVQVRFTAASGVPPFWFGAPQVTVSGVIP